MSDTTETTETTDLCVRVAGTWTPRLAHVAEVTGSVCHCAACTGSRRAASFRGDREHPRSVRGGR